MKNSIHNIYNNISAMTENEKRKFVLDCEKQFEDQLDLASSYIVDKIVHDKKMHLVTLSGPSCSGKTTTAGKLISDLSAQGKRVFIISLDDFFRSIEYERECASTQLCELDFDSVSAIDIGYLSECVGGILEGKKVYLPFFDFVTQKRCRYEMFDPHNYDVIIFEGIQAMYPDVRRLFGQNKYLSLYISTGDGIIADGVEFSGRELRFLRRIVRDEKFRAAEPSFTLTIWKGVTENEDKNILPYTSLADVTVNSALGYEVCVIKKHFFKLVDMLGVDSEFYSEMSDLALKLNKLPDISDSYVPSDSVFREFIGH